MRPGVSEATQNAVNCVGTERHKCIMRRAEHEVQLRASVSAADKPEIECPEIDDRHSARCCRCGLLWKNPSSGRQSCRCSKTPFFVAQYVAYYAALLLPLEAKKKTAGEDSQPFQDEVLQQLYPTKLFQPCLTTLQVGSHSFRLEVVVFRRARACALSAAQAGFVLCAYYEAALFG